jgi:hypothetical protein
MVMKKIEMTYKMMSQIARYQVDMKVMKMKKKQKKNLSLVRLDHHQGLTVNKNILRRKLTI